MNLSGFGFGRVLRTARLAMRPVSYADLPHLIELKADPQVFAVMLGGVRLPWQTVEELATDIGFWGQTGAGMWSAYEQDKFQGLIGLHLRPDGRGIALRFAVWPEARGRGLAREGASAALRYAHDVAGIERVIAVARADNFGSRIVLGGIGMVECSSYIAEGREMILYDSLQPREPMGF